MNGDELLHSKYDRLCVEFKKLRNKHREYKENTSKELSALQLLKSSEKEKDLRISELERECDNLRSSNAYLSKQLDLMTSHSKSGSSESSNLHNEAYTDKSVSCITQAGCSDTNSMRGIQDHISDSTPSQIHQLLSDLVTALREWTAAIVSGEKRMNFAEADDYLIDQVARLERQVGELSLQCQLERKRRSMNTEEPNSQIPNRPKREQGTTGLFPASEASITTLDSFEQRVHALTEQTHCLIALVSFLKDEIHSVSPYLLSLAREAYYQETKANRAHAELQRLRAQLDHAHSNTLQRNNEMAEHLASLTDELQELRGFGRPTGSGSLSTTPAKKGSIFYVLKH